MKLNSNNNNKTTLNPILLPLSFPFFFIVHASDQVEISSLVQRFLSLACIAMKENY
jgi:hypothetical protein